MISLLDVANPSKVIKNNELTPRNETLYLGYSSWMWSALYFFICYVEFQSLFII